MAETKNSKSNCSSKSKAMFAYGILQLGSSVISAISLAAIAISLCSLKYESKNFNNCVKDKLAELDSKALAVNYCNGGN
tara:strand:+ start:9385 stop:9621 length:237 start_codon:yes stop_codon:yes gene_type:complete